MHLDYGAQDSCEPNKFPSIVSFCFVLFQLDNVSAYLFTNTNITTVVRFLLSLNIVKYQLDNVSAYLFLAKILTTTEITIFHLIRLNNPS